MPPLGHPGQAATALYHHRFARVYDVYMYYEMDSLKEGKIAHIQCIEAWRKQLRNLRIRANHPRYGCLQLQESILGMHKTYTPNPSARRSGNVLSGYQTHWRALVREMSLLKA